MRILIVCLGTYGDLLPMLSLGRALTRRGHEIFVLSSADFATTTKQHGLQFVEVLDEHYYRNILKFDGSGKAIKESKRYLVDQPMLPLYRAVAKHRIENNTLIICSIASAYSSRTIADAFNLPSVILHFNSIGMLAKLEPTRYDASDSLRKFPKRLRPLILNGMLLTMVGPTIMRSLNRFRQQFGLRKLTSLKLYDWINSGLPTTPPVLCLGMFPKWFTKPLGDWNSDRIMVDLPSNAKYLHFPLNDNFHNESELPSQIKIFLQQHGKVMVFTFGTRAANVKSLLTTAQMACEKLKQPAIFLCQYKDSIPENLPSSIIAYPYTRLSLLLPYVKLLMHHGGAGTMTQCFLHAVPQIIRPTMGDQFDNAARVMKLGVGEEILPKRYNVKRLCDIITKVLNDESYQQACKTIQEEMQQRAGTPAIESACAHIESFYQESIEKNLREKTENYSQSLRTESKLLDR